MTGQRSLEYLYGLQRFGIKLGLDNIRQLLLRLERPDSAFPIVHIAGSNGKGSVAVALATMLRLSGYRVGLYTSPHLHHFGERIRVDGAPLAVDDLVRLTDRLRALVGDLPVTFFELTTAMALTRFRECNVDIAILEVGMGGRLDATNAVTPLLGAITPICLDHAAYLGNDLTTIAGEKGGIIKPEIPVVLGKQPPLVEQRLRVLAAQQGAPLLCYGEDYRVIDTGETFTWQGPGGTLAGLTAGLAGAHQRDNLAQALCLAALLRERGFSLPATQLRRAVSETVWPGRLEWVDGAPGVLIDGAHNAGGAATLAAYLARHGARVHWVAAIKADKNCAEIIAPLLPYAASVICPPLPVEAGIDPQALSAAVTAHGISAHTALDVAGALAAAQAACCENEIVLVAGSLFLAAAAREILIGTEARCA